MAKKPKLERNDVVAGRYRIDRVIGKGGFGAVYEASTVDSSQRVALKVMHQKLTTSAIDQRRFQRESALVQSLQHPNVVRVLDFGETDAGLPFIAFELLQGRALEQVIKAEGAMPWPRVAQISSDVLQALIAAHAIGIVHRDIKPANVFLCEGEGGTIATKVLDFGIAKSLATEAGKATQLTETGQMLGTPYYMAPEQVRGLTIGPTIDLYALGLVMAEMLTGKRAIRGESVIEVYMAQISDAPLKFEPQVEQCPLWPTIQRATAKAIDQRFKTATDMNDAVQIALRAAPVDARLAARSIPLGSTIGIDDELSGITGALFLGVGKDEPEPDSLVEGRDGRPSRHISSPSYPAAAGVGSTTPLGPASVQPERAQSSLLSRERVAQLAQLPSERSLSDSAETKLYDASGHAPQQGQRQPVNTGPTALYTPGRQPTPAPGVRNDQAAAQARPGAQGYPQSQAHPQSQAQPASQAHAHAQAQAQAQAAHLQQNRGMQGQAGNQQLQGGAGARPGTAGGAGGVSASYVAASRSPYPVAERASDYPARLARGSPLAQSAAAASNAQISPYAQPSGGAAQRPGGSFNPERTLDDVSELTLDDMPPRAAGRGPAADPAAGRGGVRGPAAGTMLMPSKEPEPAPDPLASTMHMDEAMARAYASQGAQPSPAGPGARADAGRASSYGSGPSNAPAPQQQAQPPAQQPSPASPDAARAPHYQSGVQPSPLYSSSPPAASPQYSGSSIQPSPLAAPTSDNPAIASPASPRTPRRGFPLWAILLIVAVLGGAGVALFFALR